MEAQDNVCGETFVFELTSVNKRFAMERSIDGTRVNIVNLYVWLNENNLPTLTNLTSYIPSSLKKLGPANRGVWVTQDGWDVFLSLLFRKTRINLDGLADIRVFVALCGVRPFDNEVTQEENPQNSCSVPINIRTPLSFDSRHAGYRECKQRVRDYADLFENSEWSVTSLLQLSYILQQISPALSSLMHLEGKLMTHKANHHRSFSVTEEWRSFVYPLRHFLFERGICHKKYVPFKKYGSEEHAQMLFAASQCFRTISYFNVTNLVKSLSEFLFYEKGAEERSDVTSRIRFTVSRTTTKDIPEISDENKLLKGTVCSVSWDNIAFEGFGGVFVTGKPDYWHVDGISTVLRQLPKPRPLPQDELAKWTNPEGTGRLDWLKATPAEKWWCEWSNTNRFLFVVGLFRFHKELIACSQSESIPVWSGYLREEENEETGDQTNQTTAEKLRAKFVINLTPTPEDFINAPFAKLPDLKEMEPEETNDSVDRVKFLGQSYINSLKLILENSEDIEAEKEQIERLNRLFISETRDHIWGTVDEKLYEIVQQMIRENPQFAPWLHLLMDAWHTAWNVDKTIWRVFGDCFLREICAAYGCLVPASWKGLKTCVGVKRSHVLLVDVAVSLEYLRFLSFLQANQHHETRLDIATEMDASDPNLSQQPPFPLTQHHEFWKEVLNMQTDYQQWCVREAQNSKRFALISCFIQQMNIESNLWDGQNTGNLYLLMSALKVDTGFAGQFHSFGRLNYDHCNIRALLDHDQLSPQRKFEKHCGAPFAKITKDGHWVTMGLVGEDRNRRLKQMTKRKEHDGSSFQRNSMQHDLIAENRSNLLTELKLERLISRTSCDHVPNPIHISIALSIGVRYNLFGEVTATVELPDDPKYEFDHKDSVIDPELRSFWDETDCGQPPVRQPIADDDILRHPFTGHPLPEDILNFEEGGLEFCERLGDLAVDSGPGSLKALKKHQSVPRKVIRIPVGPDRSDFDAYFLKAQSLQRGAKIPSQEAKEDLVQQGKVLYPGPVPLQLTEDFIQPHRRDMSPIVGLLKTEFALPAQDRVNVFHRLSFVCIDLTCLFNSIPKKVTSVPALCKFITTQSIIQEALMKGKQVALCFDLTGWDVMQQVFNDPETMIEDTRLFEFYHRGDMIRHDSLPTLAILKTSKRLRCALYKCMCRELSTRPQEYLPRGPLPYAIHFQAPLTLQNAGWVVSFTPGDINNPFSSRNDDTRTNMQGSVHQSLLFHANKFVCDGSNVGGIVSDAPEVLCNALVLGSRLFSTPGCQLYLLSGSSKETMSVNELHDKIKEDPRLTECDENCRVPSLVFALLLGGSNTTGAITGMDHQLFLETFLYYHQGSLMVQHENEVVHDWDNCLQFMKAVYFVMNKNFLSSQFSVMMPCFKSLDKFDMPQLRKIALFLEIERIPRVKAAIIESINISLNDKNLSLSRLMEMMEDSRRQANEARFQPGDEVNAIHPVTGKLERGTVNQDLGNYTYVEFDDNDLRMVETSTLVFLSRLLPLSDVSYEEVLMQVYLCQKKPSNWALLPDNLKKHWWRVAVTFRVYKSAFDVIPNVPRGSELLHFGFRLRNLALPATPDNLYCNFGFGGTQQTQQKALELLLLRLNTSLPFNGIKVFVFGRFTRPLNSRRVQEALTNLGAILVARDKALGNESVWICTESDVGAEWSSRTLLDPTIVTSNQMDTIKAHVASLKTTDLVQSISADPLDSDPDENEEEQDMSGLFNECELFLSLEGGETELARKRHHEGSINEEEMVTDGLEGFGWE
eukprot:Lithocolla_globosa_v1_NODE_83_length_6704_cov_20.431945.p1 type:complete len:1765 gc:universal NODE_83_length_6704_cov_20.431945:1344-6638(+)